MPDTSANARPLIRGIARFALALSLWCGPLGCADDDDAAGQLTGSLTGTVRDAQTANAVGGADVAYLADTGERASDKTDKDGRFGMTVHALSPLGRLTVSKPGYKTRVVTTFLDDGSADTTIELLRD